MGFNMGNVGVANVIEGAADGIKNAAQNLYNIRIAKTKLDNETKANDADIALKHAQADKLEADGAITNIQADQMRDYVNQQKKFNSAKSDLSDSTISTVEDRITQAAQGYHSMLTSAVQTPEGQQYVQGKMAAVNAQQPAAAPQAGQGGNPTVNAIMPSVGANEPQYNAQTPPPMSMANGQPQPNAAPQQQPVNQPPVQQQQPAAQPNAAAPGQDLPPLTQVYKGLSTRPFGEDQNDLYMKNPNVTEAIKNGNYLVRKDQAAVQAQNPLSLNENDRTVLGDVADLKKHGYSSDQIFNQLTPGTQSLIKTVGEYRATPQQLTSSMGGGRQKQELVKAVQSFYPKWSDAVYDQRHKSLIDFTDPNGKNGAAIAATRQGVEHMDELTQSIDAVSNKTIPGGMGRQIPVLNAGMNKIMQYVGGDPDILALKQNINAVSEEMTKAWGGSQAGEGRLAAWRSTMSAANSPQGWKGLLSKTAKLWEDAANARESMFGLAMGDQKMPDVLGEGVLLPEHQQILDRIKGGYTPGQNNPANKNTGSTYNPQDLQAEMKKRGLLK